MNQKSFQTSSAKPAKQDEGIAVKTNIHPMAGKPAPSSMLVEVDKLDTAYYLLRPDPGAPAQRVVFGTSGHRGSAFDLSFNEWHVLAITQAICDHRKQQGINGPLFLGADTHALSRPAYASALEVLAGNGVDVMLAVNDEFTPTPVISHAILVHNRQHKSRADGIVVTPSHNPPRDGGFKYNPPHGGPAGTDITALIEAAANTYLQRGLSGVHRLPHHLALRAPTTHRHDYLHSYVEDLGNVIDMDVIRNAGVRIGVDALGGAGIHYWPVIAERWKLDLKLLSDDLDPRFGFMTLDWDGKIRMDPASPYAMQRLIAAKDRFDVAFACDTDHDRHGIVSPSQGLLSSNQFQCIAIDYLFRHRPDWSPQAGVAKTIVSTQLIDRMLNQMGRKLFETPVGFKWFVKGLLNRSLAWAAEESAGATFLRRNGSVWTTDKDGMTAGLLAAEIAAVCGCDLGSLYRDLTHHFDAPVSARVEAPANAQQKARLAALSAAQITATELAGDKIESIIDKAPGNHAAIGGIKVSTANGWFAARPSGTENLYKIYAESFKGEEHLAMILKEAQATVDAALAEEALT